MRFHAVVAPFALTIAVAGPASAGEGYWASILHDVVSGPARTSDVRWQGRVPAGSAIEIKGVNGSIQATGSSGDEVEVVATRRGRRSDPEKVQIRTLEHAGGITVCALYPSIDPGRPNECLAGDKGRMNVKNNDVTVEFVVKVPAGVRLVARTVNGAIDASGLSADADAETVNGSVKVQTSGVARAQTVNGSVQASMGRAQWPSDIDIKTVNGSIRVTLPASAHTTVDAATVNGTIATDFTVSDGKATRRRLTGTIGGGGRALSLETVNGSIQISQAAR
jgi:putative adhesin